MESLNAAFTARKGQGDQGAALQLGSIKDYGIQYPDVQPDRFPACFSCNAATKSKRARFNGVHKSSRHTNHRHQTASEPTEFVTATLGLPFLSTLSSAGSKPPLPHVAHSGVGGPM